MKKLSSNNCTGESLQVVVDAVVAEPLSHDRLDALVGLTLGSERPLADGGGGGHGGSAGSASGLLAVLLMQRPPVFKRDIQISSLNWFVISQELRISTPLYFSTKHLEQIFRIEG